jgi:Arc/MetJ family transcription regulator
MRTNIEIDDALMTELMELTEFRTKREVIDQALRALLWRRRREMLMEVSGQVEWEGDLDEMRTGRFGAVWPYVGEGVMSVAEDSKPYDGAGAKRNPA